MALKRFFKWGVPLLFSAALLSCGGGGGGNENNTTVSGTVSGQFLASYVKGVYVCLPDNSVCVQTDDYGKFTINVPQGASFLRLNFVTTTGDYFGLATFDVVSHNITLYPSMLTANNSTLGAVLRTFLHALGGDFNNSAVFLNLSGVQIENVTDSNGKPIVDETIAGILLKGQTPVVNALLPGGTEASFLLNPGNKTVVVCTTNGCQNLNATAYNWLVLVYIMGDNNLSAYAVQTVNQMSKVSYPPQLKVVSLLDTYGNRGIAIYESLDNGSFVQTASLPEADTANATYLYNFIKNTFAKYPANNVALILWDHGDGWRYNFDYPYSSSKAAGSDLYSGDYLYMHRLREILQQLKEQGININVIGFDECSMATLEVAYDVSVNTRYIVGSEYLEPATGWNYTILMGKLAEFPYMDGWSFAKTIVDSYRENYENRTQDYCYKGMCTLSAWSTETTEKLVNNVNAIAGYYLDNISSNSSIYDIYATARKETNVIDNDTAIDNNTVDLYNFAYNLNGSIPITAPQNVTSIISTEVYSWSNNPNLYHGVGIYFPLSSTADKGWAEAYYNCTPSSPCVLTDDPNYYNPFATTTWAQFIADFVNR